ncbi:hypothetical protein JTB14_009615 [Gonioctena quinquepunctata]|nr:hypothetical protein JTB14_009615 [Gonioctena quinquepunctata]
MTKYKCFLCDSVQGKAYHTISTKPSMKSIWMRICNLEPWEKVSMIRICSDHFRPEDYAGLDPHTHPSDSKGFRYRLKKNAVPSLNLLESTPLLPRYVTNTEVTPAQLGIPVIFEDNTDNVKGEMDDSKLESDEDDKPLKKIIEEVAVKKEDPGNYSEDPLDTAGCGEVKIEDELDIKDEDFEIETDEEEPDEDDSEDEAGLDISFRENDIQAGEPSAKCNGTTGFSVYPGKITRWSSCSETFTNKSICASHQRTQKKEKTMYSELPSKDGLNKHEQKFVEYQTVEQQFL